MSIVRRSISWTLLCVLALSFLRLPVTAQTAEPAYDIVIRNGRVLDGAGNPWIVADVGIKDGRFIKIGKVDGQGKREIDARGRYVSPGWIDVMDQSGSVLPKNGLAENKLLMGVTTAIGGEGGTPVPAEKVGEYFAGLEKSGISINFGSYFSETQARAAVLGMESRAPNAEELARMKAIMETAMKAGAIGMTMPIVPQIPNPAAILFGEDQGRYVVTTRDPDIVRALANEAKLFAVTIGTTGGDALNFDLVDRGGAQTVSLAELRAAHEGFFPALMGADAALA